MERHGRGSLKESMNKWEWTSDLDKSLQEIVLRNFFNFDTVSVELNEEARRLGLNFGATHAFTNEKCRIRWSYLHLKRMQGKTIKYQQRPAPVQQQASKEDRKQPQKPIIEGKSEAERQLETKTFTNLTTIDRSKVTLGNLEGELWKKNITAKRQNKDYLDVSKEDFTKNTSVSIDGNDITPSNFNIFRDSLRQTSEQLLRTLNENLPEMNLREIEEEETRRLTDGEGSEDEDVVPLDFRTALIEQQNRVVIQAKPLALKTEEELMRDAALPLPDMPKEFDTMESYLEAVKKEPFREEEGNYILIDPDINIKEKFEEIDLACNKEQRLNNTLNAPVRSKEQLAAMASTMRKPKIASKSYDTDTDQGTDNEAMPHAYKKENLDFNNILKQWGVTDLNKMIGATSSEDEAFKRQRKTAKPMPEEEKDKMIGARVGIIETIMNENRAAQEKRRQQDAAPVTAQAMLDALASEEDSDVAPMSALVDTPSKEELKRMEMKKAEKSLKMASSTSEDELSASEKKAKQAKANKIIPGGAKRVTFEDQKEPKKQSESESEQIDTTIKKPAKPVIYKGVKIQSDNEEEEAAKDKSGSSSGDSADEYFNSQRKAIKRRLIGDKRLQNEFEKEDYASCNDDDAYQSKSYTFGGEEGDMRDFDDMMQKTLSEAQRVQEDEQRIAREEQERVRLERLRQQEERIRQDQERKQRERDELMERVKKQDEERKRRRKEEKARKDQEKELKKRLDDEKAQRDLEEKERLEEEQQRRRAEEERARRDRDETERRKENFERSIRKVWNGSEVPCLFDSKIAYSMQLYSLPVELETQIAKGEVPNEDLVFRRYKVLIIPLDSLFGRTSGRPMIELTNYFLRNSTLLHVQNGEASEGRQEFPFKCIGLVQTMALPPFNKCTLSPVQPPSEHPSAQRVIALLFDTHDKPRVKQNFNEALKSVRLTDILSEASMREVAQVYPAHMEKLALDYMQANKAKEFPYPFSSKSSPLIEFTNPRDLEFDGSATSAEPLGRIAFFMEYAVAEDTIPVAFKESCEFLRRCPNFYAYNSNPRSYSRIDSRDKLVTKYNQHRLENVCVIFKDLTVGQISSAEFTQSTSAQDSLSFFLSKATLKGGLEVCGMRLIYMDKEQAQQYEHLFNEKLAACTSLFALFLRGVDAISKCEQIVGHFNPDMARKTNEKSVRAFFGRDKEAGNCVLKMFASQKKNLSELIFWFGGRVQQEVAELVPQNTMHLVVPPRTEKQFLFLSPLVTSVELPQILQTLCDFGVSILDIQKVNYERLQYEGETMSTHLNRHLALFKVRGTTLANPVGTVLKLAREGLVQGYRSKVQRRLEKTLDHIDQTHGSAFYMTCADKEYKVVRQKLRQGIFNVSYQQLQLDHLKAKRKGDPEPNRTDYDSEDTENYREIALFNHDPKLKSKKPAKSTGDSFETQTFVCFLRVSLFRKQIAKEVLQQVISRFELLGMKLVNCKREIFNELVPVEIRTLFKKIAFKFHEGMPDLRLRKKISEFKTLVVILRGRNVENNIDKIYDRERLRFTDMSIFEGAPQAVFLTNQVQLEPFFNFLLTSKLVKLYNDFGVSHEHIMDSPVYSYMLNHNVDKLDPVLAAAIDDSSVVTVSNIVQIKSIDQLYDAQDSSNGRLSACVCVVKPNQPLTVALRTLKNIANNKDLGLTIQNLEITPYDETRIDILYRHDIEYDETIPEAAKTQALKEQYVRLFRESRSPVVHFLVSGPYAIAKMKQIIGHKDPKLAGKDSMRSFYGTDRIDNGYFISENFSESLLERDFLFNQRHVLSTGAAALHQEGKRAIKARAQQPSSSAPGSLIGLQAHQELALILFSPSIVASNDFVFVLDDLVRSKFNICALSRTQGSPLERNDLEFLFQETVPRLFNLEALEALEFGKDGGCVMAVVEKEKAVQDAHELIGRLEIKSKNDYDRYKKKAATTSHVFGEQTALVSEYGPYIFAFPVGGAASNQRKILRYFSALPNSQHFYIVNQD